MEPTGCIRTSGPSLEIVVCEGEAAAKAHRGLFTLDVSCYRMTGGDIIASVISSVEEDPAKLHIVAGWESLLKVALWTRKRPLLHDVLGLLKKAGVTEQELLPFHHADINDIFPWLYYGKRFETLRKIVNRAKSRAEAAVERKMLVVYCHMISEETGCIVASSL